MVRTTEPTGQCYLRAEMAEDKDSWLVGPDEDGTY